MDGASVLHVCEGAGILDVDDEDDYVAENEHATREFSAGEYSEYEEIEEEPDDASGYDKRDDEDYRRMDEDISSENIDEDLLEEEEDEFTTTGNEQTLYKDDTGENNNNNSDDGGEYYEEEEKKKEEEEKQLINENKKMVDEQQISEEADDAILALAAAQQNKSIIPEKLRTPQTSSGVIKRQAYGFLMNNNHNNEGDGHEGNNKLNTDRDDNEIFGKQHDDNEIFGKQHEDTYSPIYATEQGVVEEKAEKDEDEEEKTATAEERDTYNDYSDDEDGHDKEKDGMGNFFSFLTTNNKSFSLCSVQSGKTPRTSVSPIAANTEDANISPLSSQTPLPTAFSSHIIHNYDEVYCSTKSSVNSNPPISQTSSPSFVPTAIIFPEDKEIGDESLSVIREMNSSLNSQAPIDSGKPQPPAVVNDRDSAINCCSFSSAFQRVNNSLGGQDSERDIDKTMNSIILRTRVEMLRKATKNLHCAELVDVLFKDSKNPVNPSDKDLDKLKNIIAAELTMNEFLESVKITDVDSAELFRETNEKIEILLRKKIMSNPLFADAYTSTHMTNPKCNQGTDAALFEQLQTTKEKDKDQEVEVVDNTPPPATTSSQHNNENRANLHMELFRILHPDPKSRNNINMLGERITFLNRLIEYKTSNSVTWLRLINLMAGILSKAANVIFDNYEQNQKQDEKKTTETSTLSAQLKLKGTLWAQSTMEKNMSMGSIGIELVFGAASEFLEKHISVVCVDIGTLAIYLHIPVVLLKWPREFTTTSSYKTILLDSISYFSSNIAAVSPMYIIDVIKLNDKMEEEIQHEEKNMDDMSLFSQQDKKIAIKRVFNNMLLGQNGEEDVLKCLFKNDDSTKNNADTNKGSFSAAYTAGVSIIDYKAPLFNNVVSCVVDYMDKRKHLISTAFIKILRKAKLSIGVYCLKYKLSKKRNKRKKGKMARMQNLMYRPHIPVSPSPKATTTTNDNIINKHSERSNIGYLVLNKTPSTSISSRIYRRNLPHKRPNSDLLSMRIKRLKQYQLSESTSSAISSGEDDYDNHHDSYKE
uniref:Wsv313-like protein n=1 Tax=Pasiphaea japonica whispovirus TaxID=2984286 RepID=A0A9C7BRL9_9VIRU|nr:MAG: wsv313-like protein [Pasiphaea japonica whispovirus]